MSSADLGKTLEGGNEKKTRSSEQFWNLNEYFIEKKLVVLKTSRNKK